VWRGGGGGGEAIFAPLVGARGRIAKEMLNPGGGGGGVTP